MARKIPEGKARAMGIAYDFIIETWAGKTFAARDLGRWIQANRTEYGAWFLAKAQIRLREEGKLVRVSGQRSGTVWFLDPLKALPQPVVTLTEMPKCNIEWVVQMFKRWGEEKEEKWEDLTTNSIRPSDSDLKVWAKTSHKVRLVKRELKELVVWES